MSKQGFLKSSFTVGGRAPMPKIPLTGRCPVCKNSQTVQFQPERNCRGRRRYAKVFCNECGHIWYIEVPQEEQ